MERAFGAGQDGPLGKLEAHSGPWLAAADAEVPLDALAPSALPAAPRHEIGPGGIGMEVSAWSAGA